MTAGVSEVVSSGTDAHCTMVREALPAVQRQVYLNAGTNGPLPRVVTETLQRAAQEQLERGRIGPGVYESLHEHWKSLRCLIADLFGASPDEIALTRSTTEGLNIALMGMDWQRGDEVITTNLEHGGLFAPLGLVAHRYGVRVRTVDIGHGNGDVTGTIAAALSPRTRAIAISHLQWSSGAVMPLADIAALARPRGILTIVDGAQSVGQIRVALHELGVDAYAMSGQKWLCGPNGTGALYLRRDRFADIKPVYLRWGVFDPAGFVVPPAGAARYEMGEHNAPVTQAQEAGLRWLRDVVGLDWMFDRIAQLGRRCYEGLVSVPGVMVTTPPDRMAGIVCFTVAGWSVKDVADELCRRGFTIRHVDQPPCPLVARVSAGWWNTEAEVDAFVSAVAELVEQKRGGFAGSERAA
jgi:L-cysteine/cystine lyase